MKVGLAEYSYAMERDQRAHESRCAKRDRVVAIMVGVRS